jgi:DNA replication protein DnaC
MVMSNTRYVLRRPVWSVLIVIATGKTHFATALAVAAIHQGKRARFYNEVDLVNQLENEKQQGKAGNLGKQLTVMDAVILDELGYLPFPETGGAFAARQESSSPQKR